MIMANIDDIPVGIKSANSIPEYAAEHHNEAVIHSNESLENRLFHKSWQVRLKSYEELMTIVQSNSDEKTMIYCTTKMWLQYLNETNPKVLEAAIDVMLVFTKQYIHITNDEIKELTNGLIEKGVSSSKPTVKSKSIDCLSQIAISTKQLSEVINSASSLLTSKHSKLQIASAQFLNAFIQKSGTEGIKLDKLFALFEKLACSANPLARQEALSFFKCAYNRMGEAIAPFLSHLKPAQRDEIMKLISTTTSASAREETMEPIVNIDKIETEMKEESVLPIDCLSKYTMDWCEKYRALKGWKSKKDCLDMMLKSVQVPKIKTPIHSHLYAFFEGILKDEINLVVSQSIIKVIATIANGVGDQFVGWKRIVPLLISMSKDKKLEEDILKCLHNLRFSIKLHEILDKIKDIIISDKLKLISPNIKKCVTVWLCEFIKNDEGTIPNDAIIAVSKMMAKLTNDSICEIREAACQTLSIINSKTQAALNTVIDEISPQIKGKLLEAKPSPKRDSFLSTTDLEMSWNEAETKVSEKVEKQVVALFRSDNIIERKDGFLKLLDFINDRKCIQADALQELHEYLIRFCKKQMQEWKEVNSDLINSCMLVLNTVIYAVEINTKAASIVLPFLVEKCNIIKYKKSSMDIIFGIADSVGPEFVITKLINIVNYVRIQSTIKDVCTIMYDIVCEYPYKLLPAKPIVDCLAKLLPTHNKQIAIDIIKKMYSYSGAIFKTLLNDIKGSTIKSLYSELDTIQIVKEQKLTRCLRGEAAKLLQAENKGEKQSPAIDISSLITPTIIKNMTNESWKIRSDALSEIKQIISNANYKIQSNNLHEMFKQVGLRFKDAHKGVQKGYILLLGTLVDSIGTKIKQYYKYVLPNLIEVLSDKQPALRADAFCILRKFREATEGDYIIDMLAPCLIKDSPVLKTEVLKWLTMEKIGFQSCDHKLLIPGVILCLQDKLKELRKMAEQVLYIIIPYVGKDQILKAIQDEKPTMKLMLTDTINRLSTALADNNNQSKLLDNFSDTISQLESENPSQKQNISQMDQPTIQFYNPGHECIISPISTSNKLLVPGNDKVPIVI